MLADYAYKLDIYEYFGKYIKNVLGLKCGHIQEIELGQV